MNNLKYYNNNLAYDYELFLPREKREEQVPTPAAEKIVNMPEMTGKAGALRRRRQAVRQKLFAIAASAMLIALLCANIAMQVQVNETKSQIGAAQTELERLTNEETRLEMEMERLLSYKNIEQAAKELGMQKKEKSQVTYISTGVQSHAEVVDTYTAEHTGNESGKDGI